MVKTKSLTKRQVDTLKRHEKHHSKKHMTEMKSAMKKGKTFTARNSGDSWKDEYLTVIITAPFIAMFLAAVLDKREMVERIGEAFIILQSEVPEQYWTLLIIAFSASFGIKGVIKGTKTFIDGKKK